MIRSRSTLALFALTLLVSGAPLAHAQDVTPQTVSAPTINTDVGTVNYSTPVINADGTVTNGAEQTANTAAASTPTDLNGTPPTGILDLLMAKLMTLFAWLLGIAGITLDNAVYYTVVHMGSYINGLSAVGVAWRILRDIGNIVLLFGFLALGITTILDVGWYGGGTKMLPTLLLSAIFLNFSLFAAEAVVDVGNLFATQFYTQINGGVPAAPQDYSLKAISNEGISSAVMNQLGLQTIYGGAVGANGQNVNKLFATGNTFLVGFMAILLFIIAAFVFFSLAFVLVARFVVLIFLIIVAPIGIAGMAIPKLEGTASKWWGTLFGQTLTAPVMLLMLYVALAVITDASFLTGFGASSNGAQGAWTSFLGGGAGIGAVANIMLSFLVAMGLLLMVTKLSKDLGAMGGTWASNMGGKLTFGLTAASAGFVGRRTVGRLSNYSAARLRQTDFGRRTFIGKRTVQALDAGAKTSFDARATGAYKSGAKQAGFEAGTAQKGGYAGIVDAGVKDQVAYSKTLELTKTEEKEQKDLKDQLKKAELERDQVLDANPASNPGNKVVRKAAEDKYKEIEKDIKRTKFEADGKTIKNKGLDYYDGLAQREYAANLKKPLPFGAQIPYAIFTSGPLVESTAAKRIIKETSKGRADKLKDALDGFEKKTDGGGEAKK